MHNYHIKRWFSLIITCLFIFIPIKGHAEEGTLSFYVTPEFPESQVEGSNSYFDLNLDPGKTEQLTLTLKNGNTEAVTIQVTPHTAYTNVHGVVEYGKTAETKDTTLSHSLDELINTPEPIELAGNETKTIALSLHMPEEEFEGFLAGGLRIAEVPTEQEETPSDEEGVAIKNEFAYVVGVVVSNRRSSVEPELDLIDVFADQLNYRNVISTNLQNLTPTFVNQLAVEATIHRVGENDVLYKANQEMMQMAPNSNFNFPISLEGDRFQAGDYILKMTATSGEEQWQWEREFTIDSEDARVLNRQDVTIDSSVNWWKIGSIVLVILLLGVILYLLIQKKKAKANEQEQ